MATAMLHSKGSVVTWSSSARLRECVTAHFASVHRFLRSLGVPGDAIDDAAQDVFLVAAKRIDEVRPGAEKAYLFSTAVRIAHVVRRRYFREAPTDDIEETAGESNAASPDELLDQKRAEELLGRLLAGLSEELRSAFVLYEIEGMTLTEIAKIVDVPRATAASRVRRSREEFQRRLEKYRKRSQGER
ncbi:MAG: polymerase sigma factor RpoE [Labilithrix sp.]|nr:polymerase sigma factor RpoE [Labilithrix sp.]